MYRKSMILLIPILLILFVGCSKEAKDEAAKMEKEMLADTQTSVDTTTMTDTAAVMSPDTGANFEASAVPDEKPSSMMPAKPAGEGYTVQVASCEDRDYAQSLVEKYKERGYEPYVTSVTVDGQSYYRVRIGIFESISQAKALQAELADRYSVNSWIDATVNNY